MTTLASPCPHLTHLRHRSWSSANKWLASQRLSFSLIFLYPLPFNLCPSVCLPRPIGKWGGGQSKDDGAENDDVLLRVSESIKSLSWHLGTLLISPLLHASSSSVLAGQGICTRLGHSLLTSLSLFYQTETHSLLSGLACLDRRWRTDSLSLASTVRRPSPSPSQLLHAQLSQCSDDGLAKHQALLLFPLLYSFFISFENCR